VAAVDDTKTAVDDAKAAADAEALADQEKVKKALATLEEEVDAEEKRWSDVVESATKKLVETAFKSPEKAIAAAIAGPQRTPGNSDRDADRHPLKTLLFMGLKPSSRVVEMGVGRGWYTEILAPVVAAKGLFIGGVSDPEGPMDKMSTVYGLRQKALLGKSAALYGKVQTFQLLPDAQPKIAEPGSADLVLAIREMHNWQRRGTMDNNLAAIVEVLAPGGRFGVVQHRAKADAVAEESAEQGYLPEAWLIKKVEDAGLRLVTKSEINANPNDTKDYLDGVWTLPPNLRAEGASDADQAKYKAIGESDRMTLLFEKPAAK
jgi:predicted methyltransferase